MERDPLRKDAPFTNAPVQIVVPDGESVVRTHVHSGDVVVLPFASDAPLEAKEGNGNLAFRSDDVTIILQEFAKAEEDIQHPVVVETADGTPLDVAVVLAMTDPNPNVVGDVSAVGFATPGESSSINTGGIFQTFEGGAALGGFEAVGHLDESSGPGGRFAVVLSNAAMDLSSPDIP